MQAIIEIIAPIAVTLAGIVSAVIARRLTVWFDLQEDKALRSNLETALQAAAGAAYAHAARGMATDAAVDLGAGYVSARMPDTLRKIGVPTSDLGPMVQARLGALLASDPTVQGPKA